jgi:Holliday junction resolvase RusA-like endonuclease
MSIAGEFFVELTDPRPLSVNAMYSTGRNGRRFLTSAGEAFKDALKTAIVERTQELHWKYVVDEVYLRGGYVELEITLYLERLYNKSWKPGSKTKGGALQSPYQRVDGTNYIKIIEDAIVLGTGIDDSAHLKLTLSTVEDSKNPRVAVTYVVVCGDRTDRA